MATATSASTVVTADEFARRPDSGCPEDLVRGRIIRMTQPGARHGQLCYIVSRILGSFTETHGLGHILTNDSGIITQRDPETVRGADVAYYSYERLPKGPLSATYPAVVPDLIIEVRFPSDRWPNILAKVAEYLEAGVSVVCVFDDDTRSVQVYDANGPARTLGEADFLEFPEGLPGFRVAVRTFFD